MNSSDRHPPTVGRPRVVAHRGASLEYPEHSRIAYRRALELGADGLECDVRLTVDLVPVLLHDGRLDATTSATGPLGARTAAELDLVEVRARRGRRAARLARRAQRGDSAHEADDAGQGDDAHQGDDADRGDEAHLGDTDQGDEAHRHHRGHRRDGAPSTGDGTVPVVETGILRLAEFLGLAAGAGREVEVALETKHPSRAGRHLEAAVLTALAAYPTVRSSARIMSFSAGALRRVRELDTTIATVLLLSDAAVGRSSAELPAGADIAGPSVRHVRRDRGLVARFHDAGHEVHVWTVDSDADIDLLADLGVDVLISNRPGHVLDRLGR